MWSWTEKRIEKIQEGERDANECKQHHFHLSSRCYGVAAGSYLRLFSSYQLLMLFSLGHCPLSLSHNQRPPATVCKGSLREAWHGRFGWSKRARWTQLLLLMKARLRNWPFWTPKLDLFVQNCIKLHWAESREKRSLWLWWGKLKTTTTTTTKTNQQTKKPNLTINKWAWNILQNFQHFRWLKRSKIPVQHPDTLDLYHVMVIPFQIEDLCQEYTLSLKCMCLIPSRTPRAATADPRELRTWGSQRRKVFPSGLQEVLFLQPRPSDCSRHPSLSTQLLHPQRCLPEKWPFIFPCALVHNPLSCLCQESHAKQLDININVSAAPTTSTSSHLSDSPLILSPSSPVSVPLLWAMLFCHTAPTR